MRSVPGRGVLSSRAAGLEPHGVTHVLQSVHTHLLVQLRQLKHDGCAQTGSAIGGTGGDVAQMIVVRVGEVRGFERGFNGVDGASPASEDLLHIAAILHADAADVVLLVHPDEKGLVVVVEDASSIGPVASSSTIRKN